MDGVGPSRKGTTKFGNRTRKIENSDPVKLTGHEIFDNDGGDANVDRINHRLKALNVAQDDQLPFSDGKNTEHEGQLGFDPDVNSKINGSLQNLEDAGSAPVTPRSCPRQSPEDYHSDSGSNSNVGSNIHRASDLLMTVSLFSEENKMRITELANAAMEELTRKAVGRAPLWKLQGDGKTEILDYAEYMREFRYIDIALMELMKMVEVGDIQPLPSYRDICESSFESEYYKPSLPQEPKPEPLHTEASREIGRVRMNPACLVQWLMDVKQWSMVFSNIVSNAMILGVLSSTGVEGDYNQTLQVMTAEFHAPSPLVPIRESYFARYCKKITPLGIWGIVDVSLEDIFPYPSIKFIRRPSGCLIEPMPNGCSKVTWVEHVEVDNGRVPSMFQLLVASGFAFSAKRWFNTITRQCERFETLLSKSTPINSSVLLSQAERASLLKLSERMMRIFCLNISASSVNMWMPLPNMPGAEDVRFMTQFSVNERGKPPGASVGFATSLWLPASPKLLFNFLRHQSYRNKWDILSYGHSVREVAYIINGEKPENRVSMVQVVASPVLYLQESYSDTTGSYVVYAPLDDHALTFVLNGGSTDKVSILPSGFAVLPDRPVLEGEESSGSILTVAFHMVDPASMEVYVPPASLNIMLEIITETIMSIRNALTTNKIPKTKVVKE